MESEEDDKDIFTQVSRFPYFLCGEVNLYFTPMFKTFSILRQPR